MLCPSVADHQAAQVAQVVAGQVVMAEGLTNKCSHGWETHRTGMVWVVVQHLVFLKRQQDDFQEGVVNGREILTCSGDVERCTPQTSSRCN